MNQHDFPLTLKTTTMKATPQSEMLNVPTWRDFACLPLALRPYILQKDAEILGVELILRVNLERGLDS